MNELYPRSQRDNDNFVLMILKNIERFGPEFRQFILHHLAISCTLKKKGILLNPQKTFRQRHQPNNELEQEMDDALFPTINQIKRMASIKNQR